MKTSYRINDALSLVALAPLRAGVSVSVPAPKHHIAVIDASGSMSYDLPKLREQLKARIRDFVAEGDTLTLIWFSGRGEAGTLFFAESVADVTSLERIYKAIDKWLRPVGLTGFKEPLGLVKTACELIQGKYRDAAINLFFMSDGQDNQWPRAQILSAAEELAPLLAASTFVAYGHYADLPLLTAMAERTGGVLIFSEGFENYAPAFEDAMTKTVHQGQRQRFPVTEHAVGGFAFAFDLANTDLLTANVKDGVAYFPSHVDKIYYVTDASDTTLASNAASPVITADNALQALYAALSLYASRTMPEIMLPILKVLGDVRFIRLFAGCFGKQKYAEFTQATRDAAFGWGRMAEGYDPSAMPADDAFCVLDFLDLISGDGCTVLFDNPRFQYNRIGRRSVDVATVLSDDDRDEVKAKADALVASGATDALAALEQAVKDVSARQTKALKFQADRKPEGYPVSSLTYNESLANVSFLVRKTGTVDLSPVLSDMTGFGPTIETHIWRNYTVIKDGLVNIDVLPVSLSMGAIDSVTEGIIKGQIPQDFFTSDGQVLFANLKMLPIINRSMVKSPSASRLFEREFALLRAQARAKVLNGYFKADFEVESPGLKARFNEEDVAWLKTLGITDGGFSPKTTAAPATDMYVSQELKVTLKGLSSLPSLKDVKNRIDDGKTLGGPALLMAPVIAEVEAMRKRCEISSTLGNPDAFKNFLIAERKTATQEVRSIMADLAKIKFGILVGGVWFPEFRDYGEGEAVYNFPEVGLVKCFVEIKPVEIKI